MEPGSEDLLSSTQLALKTGQEKESCVNDLFMWPVLQVACEISTPVPLTRTHGHALLQKRLGNIKQLVPKRKRKQISQTIVILPQALLSCAPYPGSQQHLLDDDAEQFTTYSFCFRASLVAQTVKNPSAM